jgi:non-ribosomal peptide synthetase-like protein
LIAYPTQGKAGDNCLLASKVMIPLDGPVREGVGLLGAPSFEIPRSVKRDKDLEVDEQELRDRLWAKNVHNTISMTLFLLMKWTLFFVVTVLYLAAIDLWVSTGVLVFALSTVGIFVLSVAYNVLIEQLIRPLQGLRPQGCSIYDRTFWRHERFWKLSNNNYLNIFNGTPFKVVLWRLAGMRVGCRVFDDGFRAPERTFATIGDDCTLNTDSVIQCHSQEDGGFKSDRTEIGAGCTLGVSAWVHYGVTMGDGTVLDASSFLMKGEEVPPHELWSGNPARAMGDRAGDQQPRSIGIGDNRAAVLLRGR